MCGFSQFQAQLLYEAAQQSGWADAKAIVDRVRRLQIGLPAENELSVVLTWLGRCRLVHKLDQLQSSQSSEADYRVPDLLAIFDYGGHRIPVLVEAKTTDDSTLSWRPDYRNALCAYAAALGLPLLVAWRHKTFWTLFDVAQLQVADRNFNITFLDAMKHTLMCELASDFSFSLREGVGVHFEMRKLAKTGDAFGSSKRRACFLCSYVLIKNPMLSRKAIGSGKVSLAFPRARSSLTKLWSPC